MPMKLKHILPIEGRIIEICYLAETFVYVTIGEIVHCCSAANAINRPNWRSGLSASRCFLVETRAYRTHQFGGDMVGVSCVSGPVSRPFDNGDGQPRCGSESDVRPALICEALRTYPRHFDGRVMLTNGSSREMYDEIIGIFL